MGVKGAVSLVWKERPGETAESTVEFCKKTTKLGMINKRNGKEARKKDLVIRRELDIGRQCQRPYMRLTRALHACARLCLCFWHMCVFVYV